MAGSEQRVPSPTRTTVFEALGNVTDPELDRSIVDLEYVEDLKFELEAAVVDAGENDTGDDLEGTTVTVRITLPTAWCSPAFAWMMVVDARDEVELLPGVERARIVLSEHLHEDEITTGVNDRLTFEDVFPDADGGVDAVRLELDRKARTARQYDAVEALLEAGLEPAQVIDLRLEDVDLGEREDHDETEDRDSGEPADAAVYLRDRALAVSVPAAPIRSYLEKARATGVVTEPGDRLFLTPEEEPITLEAFDLVHRRGRLAQVNMSSQGGVCSGLHEARKKRLERSADD